MRKGFIFVSMISFVFGLCLTGSAQSLEGGGSTVMPQGNSSGTGGAWSMVSVKKAAVVSGGSSVQMARISSDKITVEYSPGTEDLSHPGEEILTKELPVSEDDSGDIMIGDLVSYVTFSGATLSAGEETSIIYNVYDSQDNLIRTFTLDSAGQEEFVIDLEARTATKSIPSYSQDGEVSYSSDNYDIYSLTVDESENYVLGQIIETSRVVQESFGTTHSTQIKKIKTEVDSLLTQLIED